MCSVNILLRGDTSGFVVFRLFLVAAAEIWLGSFGDEDGSWREGDEAVCGESSLFGASPETKKQSKPVKTS